MDQTARRRVSDVTYHGGLEAVLDVVAYLFLAGGVLIALAYVATEHLLGIFPAISALASSFLAWLLFRALAEIIRLLKKSAGMDFGGRISQAKARISYVCSRCGTPLYDESYCVDCRCRIVEDDAADQADPPDSSTTAE